MVKQIYNVSVRVEYLPSRRKWKAEARVGDMDYSETGATASTAVSLLLSRLLAPMNLSAFTTVRMEITDSCSGVGQ